MSFLVSPGVKVSEIDLTTVVPNIATTTGAFVGQFQWGPVEIRTQVTDEVDLNNRFLNPDANTYTSFFMAANFLQYGNDLRLIRAANTGTKNATSNNAAALQIKNEVVYEESYLAGQGNFGNWAARYPGAMGNNLKVSMCASANAYSLNLSSVSVTANAANIGDTTVNTTGSANTYTIAGGYVAIGSNPYIQVSSVNATAIVLASPLTVAVTAGSTILRKWEYADQFDSAPGTSSYTTNLLGSKDEIHIIVVDKTGLISGTPGTVLEKYPFLSKASDAKSDDGSSLYYPRVIFNKSRYIYWGDHDPRGTNWGNTAAGTTFTNVETPVTETLAGGVDATVTDGDLLRGWAYFVDPETVDISLIISGDASTTVQTYLISSIAEARRDCVAFVSPARSEVVNNAGLESDAVIAHRNSLPSSSYAVMDSGWKYQYDKYNDVYRWLPMNADIAGLCVRTDLTRDPWYSPAGFLRGSIKNVIKLSWVPNQSYRDSLYRNGINPVTVFPGEGFVLYGDKTMQSKPSAFDRINVRRLFIVLEKSISRFAKYSLFEFNDEFTRAGFIAAVEPYLRDVQGRRGITDFRVVCDDTNNTAQIIDSNQFVGDIYVVPAHSINFIQLNFVAVRTGVSFSEIVGKF